MGKGKNKNANDQNNKQGEEINTTPPNEKRKQEEKYTVAVLKIDFHCDGCTRRIMKSILRFRGVVSATLEFDKSTVTVFGGFQPVELAKKVQKKTGKTVQIVSPSSKKQGHATTDEAAGGLGGDEQQTSDGNNKQTKQQKVEKQKQHQQLTPNMTTVVFKLQLHCQGCVQKIHKTISTYKGVEKVVMDKEKELVTVKGAMDQKTLVEHLQRKFKRPVQIVNDKKEKENGAAKEEKQQKEGEKKNKKGAGDVGGEEMIMRGGVEYLVYGSGYQCRDTGSGYVVDLFYPPQLFSEENPNACSVM